jgi:hypothetical protein
MDITQWTKESSVILGIEEGNPFISSIVCRAFTISNSVLLRLASGYDADVPVLCRTVLCV